MITPPPLPVWSKPTTLRAAAAELGLPYSSIKKTAVRARLGLEDAVRPVSWPDQRYSFLTSTSVKAAKAAKKRLSK